MISVQKVSALVTLTTLESRIEHSEISRKITKSIKDLQAEINQVKCHFIRTHPNLPGPILHSNSRFVPLQGYHFLRNKDLHPESSNSSSYNGLYV